MKSLLLILLLAGTGLEGCATSTHFKTIQSQVAPGKHYQNIFVHSNVQAMDSRQTVEDQVVQQIETFYIPAKPSYEFFPTGSTATLVHKKEVVQAEGFDAALCSRCWHGLFLLFFTGLSAAAGLNLKAFLA